jgi:hypothetical protein
MSQHFQDVKALHTKGKQSDSHAKHFASQIPKGEPCWSPQVQRENITCEILWQGNPISAVKTFRSNNCVLCTKERVGTLKASRESPELLINSCNEIYGGCRHNPAFHRYKGQTPSTDERKKARKSLCSNPPPTPTVRQSTDAVHQSTVPKPCESQGASLPILDRPRDSDR